MSQQPQKVPYEGFWQRTMALFKGLRVRVVLADRTTVIVGQVETVGAAEAMLRLPDGTTKLVDLADLREVTQVL